MQYPPSKLPGTGTSIFTVMSALAQAHGAVNLSQGFPDFSCDARLSGLAAAAMQAGHHQYAPMPGLPALRGQVAARVLARYGADFDPGTEITITSGATEALLCACAAFVHPGDEVLIFEPAYDAYAPLIRLQGGIPVPIQLTFPAYRIPWDAVHAAVGPRTRALLLNSPHNPTGALLAPADLAMLRSLAAQHPQLLFFSDEVYEYLTFDGRPHLSLCADAVLRPRSVVISSFGKSLHITGWKVGYCLAPPALTDEIRRVHQFTVFSTATPFQHAIAAYLERYPEELDTLGSWYEQKRNRFLELIGGSGLEPLPCEGAYFQLLRYDGLSSLPDTELVQRLTVEAGVACIPVSAFYAEAPEHRIIRCCFAKRDETLAEGAARLRAWFRRNH
ncbi:MAG: methionine aminotransferase [Bacteroidia bacterium]|nr:methionine aminotransferase [Bacteroidia bacterium]